MSASATTSGGSANLGLGYSFSSMANEADVAGGASSAALTYALVEPHRLTTLRADVSADGALASFAAGAAAGAATTTVEFLWEVKQITGATAAAHQAVAGAASLSESATLVGQEVETTFAAVGRYVASLEVRIGSNTDASAPTTSKLVERALMCKYVRREIRALTYEDLNRFFDAFQTLMSTATDEGQAAYGTNYKSLDYFVEVMSEIFIVSAGSAAPFIDLSWSSSSKRSVSLALVRPACILRVRRAGPACRYPDDARAAPAHSPRRSHSPPHSPPLLTRSSALCTTTTSTHHAASPKVHLHAAADRLDDHLHDGMGFLTQHIALSNAFETSLQVTNDRRASQPRFSSRARPAMGLVSFRRDEATAA
jgi:hypothetical protein